MFFWFKKKEIILDCFTTSHLAYEYAKPDFAYKFFPDWFVKLPKFVDEDGPPAATLKACRAVKRLYTANSIIVPISFDLDLEVSTIKEKMYKWSSANKHNNAPALAEHLASQFNGFVDDSFQHIKIFNNWYLQTNKFVEFMFVDPVWNRSSLFNYCILPGIVDFKYNHSTNINLMFQYLKEPQKINFKIGDAVILISPVSDCNIKIKHHLIEEKEVSRFAIQVGATYNKYGDTKKIVDAAEKRDAMTRCPFHLR